LEKGLREQEERKDCITAVNTDYPVDETTVLRPDLAIVCNNEGEKITTALKAVVEVVFLLREIGERIKPKVYASEGVKYYFSAHPEGGEIKDFVLKGSAYEHLNPERRKF